MAKNIQKRSNGIFYVRKVIPEIERLIWWKARFYQLLSTRNRAEACSRAGRCLRTIERLIENAERGEAQADAYTYSELREVAQSLGFPYKQIDFNQASDEVFSVIAEKAAFVVRYGLPDRKTTAAVLGVAKPSLLISEVNARFEELRRDRHQHLSPRERQKKRNPERLAIKRLIEAVGDFDLLTASRKVFRGHLLDRVDAKEISADTANKHLMHVRKIVGRVIEDDGLDIANPFARLKIEGAGKGKRPPTTEQEVAAVTDALGKIRLNAELKSLILAAIDSGAGPKELCLLDPEDIKLDAPIPHILIREGEGRTIKTEFREREIPLVRYSLEAFEACPDGFPRYRRDNGGEAASAAANKFLRPLIGKTLYSFRHAFADRLRKAGVTDSLKDALMGHKTAGVGAHYGQGYDLSAKLDALERGIRANP